MAAYTNAAWIGSNGLVYESYGTLYRKTFEGETTVLAKPSEADRETYYYGVSVAPDDAAVLFSVVRDGTESFDQAAIVVKDIKSGAQKVLIEGGMSPSVTATGHLLFGRAGTLYAVAIDTTRWELRGNPVPVVTDIVTEPNDGLAAYAVSHNGTLVYLQGRSQPFTRRLLAFDRQGRTLQTRLDPGPYTYLRLSPNGEELALTRYGPNTHTWIHNLARGTLVRATEAWSNEGAEWSHDGTRMAQISTRGGEPQLFVTAPRGSRGETKLNVSRQEFIELSKSFSADGQYVLFSDGADVYRVRADGTASEEPLIATRAEERQPVVSPDGTWLAFTANDTGRDEIYVAGYPNAEHRQQVSRSGGRTPRWTKAGKELCYRTDSIWCVTMGPDGAPVSDAALIVEPKEPFGNFDVSPDGERFYLLLRDIDGAARTAPIQVVVNWFEELRRLVPVQ